jgi:predicted carbohydrate-binding protein with CBM48
MQGSPRGPACPAVALWVPLLQHPRISLTRNKPPTKVLKVMPFTTLPGHPQPLGATPSPRGVNFSLFSEHAAKVEVLLFSHPDDPFPVQVIEVPSRTLFCVVLVSKQAR